MGNEAVQTIKMKDNIQSEAKESKGLSQLRNPHNQLRHSIHLSLGAGDATLSDGGTLGDEGHACKDLSLWVLYREGGFHKSVTSPSISKVSFFLSLAKQFLKDDTNEEYKSF